MESTAHQARLAEHGDGAFEVYLLELRKMLLDDGFSGYFFHSQDSTWNEFDWVGVTFSGSADCQI